MQTVRQAVDKAYPGMVYDYALPQAFFDSCLNNGFDVRGQCVWVYDKGNRVICQSIFGAAGPLTRSAAEYFEAQGIDFVLPAEDYQNSDIWLG
jgi:hypothetical protein